MAVVSIFSGSFCRGEAVAETLGTTTGYTLLSDNDIVYRASERSSIPAERLFRCLSGKTTVFNPFTREFERSLSWLKLAMAEYLQNTRFILHGNTSHLIPPSMPHAFQVCFIADLPYRVRDCSRCCNIDPKTAAEKISGDDARKAAWLKLLKGVENPWEPSLYDMVLPVDTLDTEKIIEVVQKGINVNAAAPLKTGREAASVFMKEARIEAALAEKGHVAQVKSKGNQIILTIDRPVMMPEQLEEELKTIVAGVSPMCDAAVIVLPEAGQDRAYRKYSHNIPSRVLLVDDEREFVQTLSERLEMRDIGSAVAYDGESALEMVAEEEPDVMLLDLQMPGINGIDVLKTVKETRPEIEVIVLTGHGTAKDRDLCMKMGAFAYLEKPVDIDILSKTLVRANEKMHRNKQDALVKVAR
ncbi:MAG: response regulator [Desulfosalsimonadaceae bacterium]